MSGTEWHIQTLTRVVDGDTVHCIRQRLAQLGDDWFLIGDAKPKSIRLVWVNTPERGRVGYMEAQRDLIEWCTRNTTYRVVCYESAGWDRLLGDLLDADGNSASQWLMVEKGWPPFVVAKL